jgi:hypothetical protein
VKEGSGPAVAKLSLRRMLAIAAAAATALVAALAGCSGGGERARSPGALPAALSYIPADSGLVAVLPTDFDREPLAQLEQLGRRRGFERRLLRTLTRAGFEVDLLRGQLGNPLVLAPLASGDIVGALRLKSGQTLRQSVERQIDAGQATRLDDQKGAFRWREQARVYAALDGDDLVVAPNEKELDQALDARDGSDSLAFDARTRAALDRLGGNALLRVVGDSQRLLERDPAEADQLRRIPWLRALGAFNAVARVRDGEVAVEFRLRTDRAPLATSDLPFAPGLRAPVLHDSRAAAAVAVLEPDRLARFLERSSAVTDPDSYSRYADAIGQLRALFGIDLHKDVLQQLRSVSVAFASPTAISFQARVRSGAAPQLSRTLTRAQPALELGLEDLLRGTALVRRGEIWQVKRGRLVLAQYAVRDGSLVGSLGLGALPRADGGRRLPNAGGSLALRGDLRRIGGFLGLAFDLPKQALDVLSGLGDLTLSVRTETGGLVGRGRLEVGR